MSLWLILAVNSITFGGLLFLLSAGFSLIFGLMRIPNLMHGSFFMLGAYLGVTFLAHGMNFFAAALASAAAMAIIGGVENLFAATVGALALEALIEALRSYGEWRLVLFGALLLLTMRFARNGLLILFWQQLGRLDAGLRALPLRREARQR